MRKPSSCYLDTLNWTTFVRVSRCRGWKGCSRTLFDGRLSRRHGPCRCALQDVQCQQAAIRDFVDHLIVLGVMVADQSRGGARAGVLKPARAAAPDEYGEPHGNQCEAERSQANHTEAVLINQPAAAQGADRNAELGGHEKMTSIGAYEAMLLSVAGFQSGAVEYATVHGIVLIQMANGSSMWFIRSFGPLSRHSQFRWTTRGTWVQKIWGMYFRVRFVLSGGYTTAQAQAQVRIIYIMSNTLCLGS